MKKERTRNITSVSHPDRRKSGRKARREPAVTALSHRYPVREMLIGGLRIACM